LAIDAPGDRIPDQVGWPIRFLASIVPGAPMADV